MNRMVRRQTVVIYITTLCILFFIALQTRQTRLSFRFRSLPANDTRPAFYWTHKPERHPLLNYVSLPPPGQTKLSKVQHDFGWFSGGAQHERQEAIKTAFARCWVAYRERAWMADEIRPLSGEPRDRWAGWSATMVDALDTLWIMGFKREFYEAVEAVYSIDFSVTAVEGQISMFETTIRYLGGLLAAYDLSGDSRLLAKAIELGNTLYGAFDTPNRMPLTYWDPTIARNPTTQQMAGPAISADIGSLSLEFTRLSQLTDDPKWYDAIDRIMTVFAAQQNLTMLPGMWPVMVQAHDQNFHSGQDFSVGALADSLYEYLPKMVLLLGGSAMYHTMYTAAVDAIIQHLLFRPMLPDDADVLLAGKRSFSMGASPPLKPEAEHLGCFIGGLVALGGRLIGNETHVQLGRRLTDGCIWAYANSPLGIMPEDFSMAACSDWNSCNWTQSAYHQAILDRNYIAPSDQSAAQAAEIIESSRLPMGFTGITNRHYILRPEALESVFVLYRITGDPKLREDAWQMWVSIQNATITDLANAALSDVTDLSAPKMDEMESFWLAETLKYLYLIFSEPSMISLDEYVLNTEAHPLRRRRHVF